ncbi:Vesicle trafficking between the ER and Golgi [Irineochytrium annulatum]|nr:Vesicle trafficking between the ER and Golgi [Irineochytrium annulatum]
MATSSSPASALLRAKQKDAVIAMLNLNNRDAVPALQSASDSPNLSSLTLMGGSAAGSAGGNDPIWKVLIYDKACQEIISPLMKVNELRENGVTVHMQLAVERQPIPDVPAVYFVQPTPENVKRIGEDLTKNLYESYYINFSSILPRPLLEDLAAVAIAANARTKIAQVYDQHLNFVSLEPSLFTLNFTDTYRLLNDPASPDTTIDLTTDRIAGALFSVLVTAGVTPVIRSPPNTSASAVAQKLETRLRDHLMNRTHALAGDTTVGAALSRPVLILLDRNFDLATMLAHTWTYSTLVHDVLEMRLNRLIVEVEEDKGRKVRRTYDVDQSDFFWKRNMGLPFPQVAEDVSAELNRYKKDVEEITRSSGVSSLEEVDGSASAQNLKVAMTALPELTERKRILDMHMNIATALFKHIGDRKLDAFFSLEEAMGKQSKAAVMESLRDNTKDVNDKLRLLLIYYLSVEDPSKEDLAAFEEAIKASGGTTASLTHVKNVRSFVKMTAAANSGGGGQQPASTGFFDRIGSTLAGRLEGTGVGGGFENLISGVKNLLPSRKDLPITRVVEAIMEGNTGGEADDFITLDPRAGKSKKAAGGQGRQTYQEAIVFVVGGGNYLEYQNLVDYAARGVPKKRITYGSTEVMTAKGFLSVLEQLGGGAA